MSCIIIPQYIYKELFRLGVSPDKVYSREGHSGLGYYTASAAHLRTLLEEKGIESGKLAAEVGSFTLAANICELYNLGSLNMKEMVSWQNIDAIEIQAKKNLQYFVDWKNHRDNLRASGYENWEKTFIALDTFDIMRLTTRGSLAYMKCLIDLAASTPVHLLPRGVKPKFAVSRSHNTTSFIEAWFSLARIMGFDEAIKYTAGVANRLLSQGIKEALKDNPSYDAEDVGHVAIDVVIGPREIANLHKTKRQVRDLLVEEFKRDKFKTLLRIPVFADSIEAAAAVAAAGAQDNDATMEEVSSQPSPEKSRPTNKRAQGTTTKSPFKSTGGLSPKPKESRSETYDSSSDVNMTRETTVGGETFDTSSDVNMTPVDNVPPVPTSSQTTTSQQPTNPYANSKFLPKPPSQPKPATQPLAVVDVSEEEELLGTDLPPTPVATPEQMMENALERLRSKSLRGGYASYLMEQENFGKWLLLAKESREVWPWFNSFLKDLTSRENCQAFDKTCQKLMSAIFEFAKNALEKRKNNSADSFEYQVWQFFTSQELNGICSTTLPTDSLRNIKAGHSILADMLGEVFKSWLITELRGERMKRDPDLFKRRLSLNLSRDELKSEVNRILAWAIKGVRDKVDDESSPKYRLLNSMVCQKKDVDESYLADRYDLGMAFSNVGGEGSLTLVSEPFFEWGMNVMRTISKALTVEDMEARGTSALKTGRKAMLKDDSLRNGLILLFSKQCLLTAESEQPITFSTNLSTEMYQDIMIKTCNCRFGEVVENYNEKKQLTGRGKVNFRGSLLSMRANNGGEASASAASTANGRGGGTTNATVASSTVAASSTTLALANEAATPPNIRIVNLNRGENGAVPNKIFDKKIFVIAGQWEEVCSDNAMATEAVKNAITRFGGEVKSSMSRNTGKCFVQSLDIPSSYSSLTIHIDYFLAGPGASSGKFKSAENNKAVVIDLDRLQRVLLGLITLEQLHTMDKLDNKSFHKKNYVPAVVIDPRVEQQQPLLQLQAPTAVANEEEPMTL